MLGSTYAEMAQPGKAAVSKTAGANLGSSNLSLGAIPFSQSQFRRQTVPFVFRENVDSDV